MPTKCKSKHKKPRVPHAGARSLLLALLFWGMAAPYMAIASGNWVPLVNQAPSGIVYLNLLSDGSVMAQDTGYPANNWYRLAPDSHGSYLNGTWTQIASMHDGRNAYATQVLRDGRVFVAGGESGGGADSAESYDPLLNNWTMCPGTGALFSDSISEVLPNGDVLIAPVGPTISGDTMIYIPASNIWIAGPMLYRGGDQDEASWVKLTDNSILTIDPFGTNSERYIPSLNQWINDASIPVNMYGVPSIYGDLNEIGAALLLPSGNAFFLGSTGNTAIYIPSGSTNMGLWVAGPVIPNGQATPDAPAAMMANGKVLCIVAPIPTSGPQCSFYEYDSIANAFTITGNPGNSPYYDTQNCRMLDLPNGTVLFASGSRQLYEYQPDGSPLAAGQPTIIGITTNFYRSYHLTGTLLNGLTEGAGFGDDAQMNSNYPLVRMTNSDGLVYYARTYNWSSTGVMTGTNIVSTEFMVPQNLPTGNYSLVVVANGNSSAPIPFTFNPDALNITMPMGFVSSGPISGPFKPSEQTYLLNNTGTSTLNWSLVNTSIWFNVSPDVGALMPGGQSTVIASVSSEATNLPVGIYTATVWFTNLSSGAARSIPFELEISPLIQNGGFEFGSFADWDLSFNQVDISHVVGNYDVFGVGQDTVHSGNYSAFLGTNDSFGYLSQTISTVAEQSYLLSFFVNAPLSVGISNEFAVSWDGIPLFDEQQISTPGYTNLQFLVTASNTNTTLQFSYFNVSNWFILDDVSLSVLPSSLFIAAQPRSQIIPAGDNAIISVLASGPSPITYEWQRNGVNILDGGDISGSATPNLSVKDAVTTDGGSYTVIVDSGSQSLTSVVATLTVAGISLNCAVPSPTGLISWWPGDGGANDLAGTNNGTPENGVGYVPGVAGYAFSLNGVNQFIYVPDNPSWDFGTNDFTMELWANYLSTNGSVAMLANDEGAGNTRKWIFGFNGSALQLLVGVVTNNGYYISSSSFSPALGEWYHIALTRSGSTFNFFINGSLFSTNTSPVVMPSPNAPLTIGNAEGGFPVNGLLQEQGFPFNGLLEDIRVYNRALLPYEIQAIYAASNNGMCAPSPAPSFIDPQPLDQNVTVGGTAAFAAIAECSAPFAYQWRKNGQPIQSANTSAYTIEPIQVTDAGEYDLVASNQFGWASSRLATLSVILNPSANCAVSAPSGLVSWWSGELSADDRVGTNNGVFEDGAVYAPGEVGYAFSFNGSNYVEMGDQADLDMSGTFSFEGWIYPTGSGTDAGQGGILINKENQYEITRTPAGNIKWAFANSIPGWNYIDTGAVTPLNQWTHVAVVYSNGLVNTYLDGILTNTYPGAGLIGSVGPPNDFRIGGRSLANQFFQGLIDEVRVYSLALSPFQIKAIFQAGADGMCPPTPLLFSGPPRYSESNGIILNASLRSGQSYHLQANTNLGSTNWVALTNFIAGTAPVISITNKPPTNIPQQFYRIISP
jgi:hypothetical protein